MTLIFKRLMKKSRPPKNKRRGAGKSKHTFRLLFPPKHNKGRPLCPSQAMFHFPQFQWQVVSHCKNNNNNNIKWESPDIHLPQFFRSHMTLRRVMNSHAFISPGTDRPLSYLRGLVRAPVSHLLTGASRLPGGCPGSSVAML